MSMNICLVGDFSENLDEGFKNTSHYLAQELEKRNSVLRLNVKNFRFLDALGQLRRGKPQIIHTIAQPTNQSFAVTYLLRRFWPSARTAVSALRPEKYFRQGEISQIQRKLMHLIKPNLVLTQTDSASDLFAQLRCTVAHLPNGVDLNRFRPVDANRKSELRKQYRLDSTRPIVLHVGHLEEDRNLFVLRSLPRAGMQVIVAGSLCMGTNRNLIDRLKWHGFHIFEGYQPNVEELYQLADCYVFPPQPGNNLAMPLSVLEAMACNLPVVTTRFSGLVDAFAEGQGLRFVGPNDDFVPQIQELLNHPQSTATRRMVRKFSWQSITNQLEEYYQKLWNHT